MSRQNQANETRCGDIEPQLSALIDRELSTQEQRAIETHLETCTTCTERLNSFRSLDHWIAGDLPASNPIVSQRSKRFSHSRYWPGTRGWSRLLVAGLAATVLLAIFFRSPEPKPEGTELLNIAPAVHLTELNRRSNLDQSAMIETMQYDLRALKLELGSTSDNARLNVFANRIDELMRRIEAVKSDDHETLE